MATSTDMVGELSEGSHSALFPRDSRDASKDSISFRLPLAIAMLSVVFEHWQQYDWNSIEVDWADLTTGVVICSAVLLCLFSKWSRFAVVLFTATAAFEFLPQWMVLHNHGWLALWTIPMAIIFRQWWRSELFS